MKEEKARLLEYLSNYWAPEVCKLEITSGLSPTFAQQIYLKFNKLEEIRVDSFLYRLSDHSSIMTRLESRYEGLKRASLPLIMESPLIDGITKLVILKTSYVNFELLLHWTGCNPLCEFKYFDRFVSAVIESSSSVQLLKIDRDFSGKLRRQFEKDV